MSLIIPTYNKWERLQLVLETLKCQTYSRNDFEVIIINDGAQDGTESLKNINNIPFQLQYIEQENKGRAAARNAGIKQAIYPYIIFIDDDTLLCNNFIEEHMKRQCEGRVICHGMIREIPYVKFFKDPSKGILYDIFKEDSSVEKLKEYCISKEDIQYNFKEKVERRSKITGHEKIVQAIIKNKKTTYNWMTFSGGNMCMPKEWLLTVDGFDEKYIINWGCEDVDLGYQLMLKGYPFTYCDLATNFHLDHYHANYIEQHRKNAELFYGKYNAESILWFQEFVEGKIKSKEMIQRILTV